MSLGPMRIVIAHLFDVMRNVALLDGHPAFQRDGAQARMSDVVIPGVVGESTQQFVRGLSKMDDDVERFTNALIEITQRLSPAATVKFGSRATRLGDESPAAYVSIGLGVGEVNDD